MSGRVCEAGERRLGAGQPGLSFCLCHNYCGPGPHSPVPHVLFCTGIERWHLVCHTSCAPGTLLSSLFSSMYLNLTADPVRQVTWISLLHRWAARGWGQASNQGSLAPASLLLATVLNCLSGSYQVGVIVRLFWKLNECLWSSLASAWHVVLQKVSLVSCHYRDHLSHCFWLEYLRNLPWPGRSAPSGYC